MNTSRQYLNPEILARLARLDLKARLVVEGFLTGLHHSPYKGFSQEFADYRQYMPGDEPKRIDWKVYGRRDRFYIREYQEETNLRGYILLDKSGSMGYGENPSKLEYAKCLAASLAYLLFKQKDGVGIITFDTKIQDFIPPSAKRLNFTRILDVIDRSTAGAETSLAAVLFELAQKIKRRGLVIIITDLLDDPESVLKSLRSFRCRKHEILVLQVLDAKEQKFPFTETALFYDLETGEQMVIQPGAIRESYRRKFQAFLENYHHRLLEAHIDCETVSTETPYDRALFAFLQKRIRLL